MEHLEDLKTELNKKIKELTEIYDKKEVIESKIPQNKKKYEGKYFKYKNGNGGDKEWYIHTL